ncbi:YicC family protein [Planctomycetota bacterium]|nr:YicC family protein [Planctomycetota bacterium]
MTGFGRATSAVEGGSVTIEIKTVNNRFLKTSLRLPDLLSSLEPEFEKNIRGVLARGSVTCQVQYERQRTGGDYQLDRELLDSLFEQLSDAAKKASQDAPRMTDVAGLPGVVREQRNGVEVADDLLKAARTTLKEALVGLVETRASEGTALQADLDPRVKRVAELSERVGERAPQVVEEYREKLFARISKLTAKSEIELDAKDLAKEVAMFADRCDITEETTRLAHHCGEFLKVIAGKGEVGRRLDFVAQEMLRETNTIASKANDAEIATVAVEMKSELEKIKEQVQNLE